MCWTTPSLAVGLALPPWLDIVLIGATTGWLGQSLWLREIAGREDGAPPPVDLAVEKANGDFVRQHILNGTIRACHDVSDGGVLVALAEMAMASGIGARMMTPIRATFPAMPSGSVRIRRAIVIAVPDHAAFRPDRRSGRHTGCTPWHLRRAGFDTAGWRHNIDCCSASGA